MKKTSTVLLLILMLTACDVKFTSTSSVNQGSNVSAAHVNRETACIDGVLYYVMWNNNPFDNMYITSPKINGTTGHPQHCEEK